MVLIPPPLWPTVYLSSTAPPRSGLFPPCVSQHYTSGTLYPQLPSQSLNGILYPHKLSCTLNCSFLFLSPSQHLGINYLKPWIFRGKQRSSFQSLSSELYSSIWFRALSVRFKHQVQQRNPMFLPQSSHCSVPLHWLDPVSSPPFIQPCTWLTVYSFSGLYSKITSSKSLFMITLNEIHRITPFCPLKHVLFSYFSSSPFNPE